MKKQQRRKNKSFRLYLTLALYVVLASCALTALWRLTAIKPPDTDASSATASVSPAIGAGRINGGLQLMSSNAILFDPADGHVFYAKNAYEKAYPASLTKVMTALIAVEQIDDLDAPVTLEYADYAGLYELNAAMAGFTEGETVTVRDLLYATLLPSGAEAARALARVAAGSQADCIAIMNDRAQALGMTNTHFTNVTGLHDPEHYTTVYDLSLLLTTALKNEDFAKAFSTFSYTSTTTEQHPNGLLLTSTLTPRVEQLQRDAKPIIGAKTGYTEEAQLCLASVGEYEGVTRAIITVGAAGDGYSDPTHLVDAYLLYEKSLPHSKQS
ncbi:MAG: D-alanyl-D-alanine carboxypeptidase family protein [Candidatus Fimivivens sp.]